MSIKTFDRIKQVSFLLATIAFISSIFLFGLYYGLGIAWQITHQDNKFFAIGFNPVAEITDRYLIISVLFLLFIAFQKMRDKVFLKVTALIPLALIILQCRFLIITTPVGVKNWITEYSSWLGMTLYLDVVFLALTFILLTLQLCLIWRLGRLSSHKNP